MSKYITTIFFCCILSLLSLSTAVSQSKLGIPFIKNFPSSVYGAGNQNFALLQTKEGILFVGNSSGVLTYDGNKWKLIEVTNKSEVHSLAEDENGKIYVGAQGDFGYLKPSPASNTLEFVSLLSLLPPADRNFNDVWNIYCSGKKIIFRSTAGIYIYDQQKIKTIRLASSSHRSFFVYGDLFIRENNYGLRKLVNDSLVSVPEGDRFLIEPVYSIFPFEGKRYLLVTENQGMFLYDGKHFTSFSSDVYPLIKGQSVYGQLLPDSSYALCSRSEGLIIMNRGGRLVHHLSKSRGLVNESVWAVCVDRFSGNIWVATNNGISLVELASPFYTLQQTSGIGGQVYHMVLHQGIVYAATSLGVYKMDLKTDLAFKIIPELQNQAWRFYCDSTSLMVATNNGIFQIWDKRVSNIGFSDRSWFFLPLKSHGGKVLVNTAKGFLILKKKGDVFILEKTLPRFFESLYSFFEDEKGNVWAESPIKGIYKIRLPDSEQTPVRYQLFNSGKGFPSDFGIKGFTFNGEIRFSTNNGVFRYDEKKDTVYFDPEFNRKYFGSNVPSLNWVEQDKFGSLWFLSNQIINEKRIETANWVYENNGRLNTESDLFWRIRDFQIHGFLALEKKDILIATSEGVLSFQPNRFKQINYPVVLCGVKLTKVDSTLVGTDLTSINLPFKHNSLKFEYTGLNFAGVDHYYQTYLEGFDDTWQRWSPSSTREFTNLPSGDYVFRIRSRNAYNRLSDELVVTVKIGAPWFRTWWAFIIFGCFGSGVIFLITSLRSHSLLKKNENLERLVRQRTSEIEKQRDDIISSNALLASQKEEIEAQKDDIELKNSELEKAGNIIALQNAELRSVNLNLETIVNERTTELKRAYTSLLQTKKELDTFIYRSSHDIKGPLLRILGLCNIALLDVKDEVSYFYFKKLETEMRLTNKILHKLIVFHAINNHELCIDFLNLKALIRSVIEKQASEVNLSSVEILVDNSLNVELKSDSYLLEVAFENIIENAVLYANSSHPKVRIWLEEEDRCYRVHISDNGVGILPEVQPRVFDMFFRGTERSRGAGLGLYNSRVALEKINSSIELKKSTDTIFIVSLPREPNV